MWTGVFGGRGGSKITENVQTSFMDGLKQNYILLNIIKSKKTVMLKLGQLKTF